MLDDMGFYANAFDGDEMLSCSLEQLEDARSRFVGIMVLMVGEATKPKVKIALHPDSLREHLTGSLQYDSAYSGIESDGSISIRRMSLGPSRGSFLQDRIGKARIEALKKQTKIDVQPQQTGAPMRLGDQEKNDLNRYFYMAIKKHEAEQREAQRMNR